MAIFKEIIEIINTKLEELIRGYTHEGCNI